LPGMLTVRAAACASVTPAKRPIERNRSWAEGDRGRFAHRGTQVPADASADGPPRPIL
jgi:hypothetical protein